MLEQSQSHCGSSCLGKASRKAMSVPPLEEMDCLVLLLVTLDRLAVLVCLRTNSVCPKGRQRESSWLYEASLIKKTWKLT
ncbi:hypothetical protein KC19_VG187700 [Ceratodon purpureus]|uniref:Uncharacterized protein n=1 Tax=Ceratodon purpureus TaxID=3225 RepID=A0A8T0HRG6_CERPU|nr:hypothetical protein KC19_VG187700 [Ceratodon purpureus]